MPSTTSATLVELEFHSPIKTSLISSAPFTFNNFIAQLDDDGLGNVRIFQDLIQIKKKCLSMLLLVQ